MHAIIYTSTVPEMSNEYSCSTPCTNYMRGIRDAAWHMHVLDCMYTNSSRKCAHGSLQSPPASCDAANMVTSYLHH